MIRCSKFVVPFTFRDALRQIHASALWSHPTARLWQRCLSIDSQFCHAVVTAGYLSWEQMVNAACRYCLGMTKNHGVIFWQIDREGRVHDGKVMYYGADCHRLKDKQHTPTWVSHLLARRHHFPRLSNASTSHCLFGLHLLSEESEEFVIAVVEAEKSALILSEHYPQYVWLAAGGLGELQPDKFRPLRGRKVILFPDTDPDGIAFRRWYDVAQQVMQQPFWEGSPPIRVSPILEQKATPEQKQRKIDIVDMLFAP